MNKPRQPRFALGFQCEHIKQGAPTKIELAVHVLDEQPLIVVPGARMHDVELHRVCNDPVCASQLSAIIYAAVPLPPTFVMDQIGKLFDIDPHEQVFGSGEAHEGLTDRATLSIASRLAAPGAPFFDGDATERAANIVQVLVTCQTVGECIASIIDLLGWSTTPPTDERVRFVTAISRAWLHEVRL